MTIIVEFSSSLQSTSFTPLVEYYSIYQNKQDSLVSMSALRKLRSSRHA